MRMQLSVQQKYRICQVMTGLGFLGVIYGLSRMSPWASPHRNKVVFALVVTVVAISLPFALGFYYYRSKLHDVETGWVEAATLGHAGEKSQQVNAPKKDKSS